jgi:hypothetical protein
MYAKTVLNAMKSSYVEKRIQEKIHKQRKPSKDAL